MNEVRSKKAALQKLAVILEPINDVKCQPKKMMTFRGFIEKYRSLKLANKKGTTVHGYETNIRAHYLPEFGHMQLSEISIESVQTFLNHKPSEGKAVQTLKNLKWGFSSTFVGRREPERAVERRVFCRSTGPIGCLVSGCALIGI